MGLYVVFRFSFAYGIQDDTVVLVPPADFALKSFQGNFNRTVFDASCHETRRIILMLHYVPRPPQDTKQ